MAELTTTRPVADGFRLARFAATAMFGGVVCVSFAEGTTKMPSAPPVPPGREAWTFRDELARPERPPKFAAAANAIKGDFWVRNRISRCYFSPIKRPPFNRDELADDIDYYPEPYLARLRREGVNGLWITVEFEDLLAHPGHLAKLRATTERCAKHGIKIWLFAMEPKAVPAEDERCRRSPELFPCRHPWNPSARLWCPSDRRTLAYLHDSLRDIFRVAPKLGGLLSITHGERCCSCFSLLDALSEDGGRRLECPACRGKKPWELHYALAEACVGGMREVNPQAEMISWFYMPYATERRAQWVSEAARHLPDGVTLMANFESGIVRDQMGRSRIGGDYWLSAVGPSRPFAEVASAARSAGAPLGAKIQVCNSHECATVPFVPVPGLLYRKYRAMREMGVSTVLQCWYFGNYPGLMNEAAGLLSREAFADDELSFLKRLAAPHWGPDAALVADVWRRFSDAYAEYPLSNNMQYYGPFHAGVAWPLLPDVCLSPLGRTWMPLDPPSGDAIGECLENHTIEEASELASRMARGVQMRDASGRDVLDVLADRWKGDDERTLDIGVMKALACQFASGDDIFAFYRDRATAIYESRVRDDRAAALAALERMDVRVVREQRVTRRLLPLAEADSRLGFHSEAESHQYHPGKLRWRLGMLEWARTRIGEIKAKVAAGEAYPESDFERRAARCSADGSWTEGRSGMRFRSWVEGEGDIALEVKLPRDMSVFLITTDAAGASHCRKVSVKADGKVSACRDFEAARHLHKVVRQSSRETSDGRVVSFALAASGWENRPDRRPEWLQFVEDAEGRPGADQYNLVWPVLDHPDKGDWRLNVSPARGDVCGRLSWGKRK